LLEVLSDAAHAVADGAVVGDDLEVAEELDHLEAEIRLDPEAEGAPCWTGKGSSFSSKARMVWGW
jgi:hypothetical protein